MTAAAVSVTTESSRFRRLQGRRCHFNHRLVNRDRRRDGRCPSESRGRIETDEDKTWSGRSLSCKCEVPEGGYVGSSVLTIIIKPHITRLLKYALLDFFLILRHRETRPD